MLPQTQEHRQKLNRYISECVAIMKEKDLLDESIKDTKDLVKEELDMISAKEFSGLVKVAYDQSKVETEIEERQTAISNVQILLGKGE